MTSHQENRLEIMLRLTAEDREAHYKKCLATLLDSHVFILLTPFIRRDLSNLVNEKGKFRAEMWKTKYDIYVVPFFSSFVMLKSIVPKSRSLRLWAYDFFLYNQGRGLSLNPGHPHGLNFNNYDTERLLRFDYRGYLADLAAKEYEEKKKANVAKVINFSEFRPKSE